MIPPGTAERRQQYADDDETEYDADTAAKGTETPLGRTMDLLAANADPITFHRAKGRVLKCRTVAGATVLLRTSADPAVPYLGGHAL